LSFRYVYMENCDCNLEHFIGSLINFYARNKPYVINENWCNLPSFSHDITDALISLHNQGIHLNGKIYPWTVLVQQRGTNTVPKVILPERHNVFNKCQEDKNASNEYNIEGVKGVEALDERERDLFSFCLLIYFVQTCGHTRKFLDKADSVLTCQANFQRKLEKEKRCLAAESSFESRKYRMWKNSLAGHFITYVLKHLGRISTSKLLRHPFFWNNWQILNFISKAASYVHEGAPCQSVKDKLEKAIDFATELKSYEKISDYMEAQFRPTGSKPNPKTKNRIRSSGLGTYFELLKAIRNKVRVQARVILVSALVYFFFF
jgi:hypothetical protein